MARTARSFASRSIAAPRASGMVSKPVRRGVTLGNQARLRSQTRATRCAECESDDKPARGLARADTTPPTTSTSGSGSGSSSAPPATSVDVWGLTVNKTMCGCKSKVSDNIAWNKIAAKTYADCDTAANATGVDIEACFNAAQPGTTVAATTDASGTVTLPPASADPCQRIMDKGFAVHETMHARHTDDIARAQGPAFFKAWQKLTGDPHRLDKIRLTFPTETANFETKWQSGSDWAQDEVHSYTWQGRFLESALAALNKIC